MISFEMHAPDTILDIPALVAGCIEATDETFIRRAIDLANAVDRPFTVTVLSSGQGVPGRGFCNLLGEEAGSRGVHAAGLPRPSRGRRFEPHPAHEHSLDEYLQLLIARWTE